MAFTAKGIDWVAARAVFVERPQRPTYEELAKEFDCAAGSLARLSSEEGWPALRAQHMDAQLEKADASAVLLAAVKVDRTMLNGLASFAVVTIASLTRCVESIADEKAPQTKAQALNTCCFAAKNLADALRAVGIIGVSKTLDGEGKMDNGRWDPKMLQQINIQVGAMAAQAGAGPAVGQGAGSAQPVAEVDQSAPAA